MSFLHVADQLPKNDGKGEKIGVATPQLSGLGLYIFNNWKSRLKTIPKTGGFPPVFPTSLGNQFAGFPVVPAAVRRWQSASSMRWRRRCPTRRRLLGLR